MDSPSKSQKNGVPFSLCLSARSVDSYHIDARKKAGVSDNKDPGLELLQTRSRRSREELDRLLSQNDRITPVSLSFAMLATHGSRKETRVPQNKHQPCSAPRGNKTSVSVASVEGWPQSGAGSDALHHRRTGHLHIRTSFRHRSFLLRNR